MQFIRTEHDFNASKNADWAANHAFWANEFKRHENSNENTKQTIALIREEITKHKKPTIIDVGCGHAWILDALKRTNGKNFKYWGLDYMPGFISKNAQKYAGDKNVQFFCCDVSTANVPSLDIFGIADVVVNHFNMIEIWDIDHVFYNMAQMMKPNALAIVSTTDAIPRIAALSADKADYEDKYKTYAKVKSAEDIVTDKHIIRMENTIGYKFAIPGVTPPRYLHAVAHSFADYINAAAWQRLYLAHVDELYHLDDPNNLYSLYPALVMQFRKLKNK